MTTQYFVYVNFLGQSLLFNDRCDGIYKLPTMTGVSELVNANVALLFVRHSTDFEAMSELVKQAQDNAVPVVVAAHALSKVPAIVEQGCSIWQLPIQRYWTLSQLEPPLVAAAEKASIAA